MATLPQQGRSKRRDFQNPSSPLVEAFILHCWLLMNRAVRGLACDSRSLRALAKVAEEMAKNEEWKAA
jgi:hypothetical protein